MTYEDDEKKTEAYFKVITDHIVRPIAETDVKCSCVATLLMLFAAIDGLGKLVHLCDKASVRERIKAFLSRMGSEYAEKADKLYDLRNSLMHNALNTVSHMAAIYVRGDHHLKTISPFGLIYLNTSRFFEDFRKAGEKLKEEISGDRSLHSRAASRLEWVKDDPQEHWLETATPPGPVQFIAERESQRGMD